MSESNIQSRIRLRCSRGLTRLFRNQVGTYMLADGRRITSGLCPGSSDLIGWRTVEVTPAMVGSTVAVFTAVEVKRPGQKPADHQQRFIDAVNTSGGIAFAATSEIDAEQKINDAVKGITHG